MKNKLLVFMFAFILVASAVTISSCGTTASTEGNLTIQAAGE